MPPASEVDLGHEVDPAEGGDREELLHEAEARDRPSTR
jgi:hypothetical protein